MSPPAAEAGGRQYRDATETCSCAHAALSSDTHMHIMSMAVPEASLRLRGWMDGHKGKQSIQLYEKQHKTKGGAQALFTHCVSDYFSYTLSSIIHTLLGNAYAEADVVLKKKRNR